MEKKYEEKVFDYSRYFGPYRVYIGRYARGKTYLAWNFGVEIHPYAYSIEFRFMRFYFRIWKKGYGWLPKF